MLPDQVADELSTASMAKLSLPPAKQGTLANEGCTTQLSGQLTPLTNQQQCMQQQQKQQVGGMLKQPGSGSKAAQHGASPMGWIPPAQMILPRAGIFYCGSFASSCGLPKHSELLRNYIAVVGHLQQTRKRSIKSTRAAPVAQNTPGWCVV